MQEEVAGVRIQILSLASEEQMFRTSWLAKCGKVAVRRAARRTRCDSCESSGLISPQVWRVTVCVALHDEHGTADGGCEMTKRSLYLDPV